MRKVENDRIWFRNFDECVRLMNLNNGQIPPTNQCVNFEGVSVAIGLWIKRQRSLTVVPENSEKYRLLNEYRMLEPNVRGKNEAKLYNT